MSGSILYRYPGEVMEPGKDEVAEAIRLAERVLEFIQHKINM